MPEYDNTNTISLWKNDKDGNEKRPDLTGKLNIDGTDYKVSVWKNDTSENPNRPILRGQVQPAESSGPKIDPDIGF